MECTSTDPSVVRSVKQRDLLNAWLRAFGKDRTLPMLPEYRPERIADELVDMMGYDVEGDGEGARFLITQEGTRLTTTYGNEHIDPDKRTNRYLGEAIGPMIRAVIDLDFTPGAAVHHASDDVIELS